MRQIGALVVLACLVGCGSEQGFSPRDGGGPDGDLGASGGWGDWDIGSVPDVSIALVSLTDEPGPTGEREELLIIDLRGQVLDRWMPPADFYGQARSIDHVQAAGPGRLIAQTSSVEEIVRARGGGPIMLSPLRSGAATVRGTHDVWKAGTGSDAVWLGDLVARTWTRVLHVDPQTGELIVDQTGARLPRGTLDSPLGGAVVVDPSRPDRLLLTWHSGGCSIYDGQRVLDVPLTAAAEAAEPPRLWRLDQTWGGFDDPVIDNIVGGLAPSGDRAILATVRDDLCRDDSQQDGGISLVHWTPGQAAEVLADDLLDGDEIALAVASDVAWVVSEPRGNRDWWLRWVGADEGHDLTLDFDGDVRPVAALDPEHGAGMVLLDAWDAPDELVLVAGGRDVWRIDTIRDGLGSRDLVAQAGAVVPLPE